jgi:hypothetical protein
MFMILGAVAFLLLIGSAVLGVVMLLIVFGLIVTRTWRRAGVVILCAGVIGSVLGLSALFVLNRVTGNAQTPVETWILFAAGGFGWAALVSTGVVALTVLLRQPNRWVERRRNANA